MRLRPNLKSTLRGVSEEEYAILYSAADERRTLDPEERRHYPVPEEADASIVGAILWSTFVLWQDHPTFVMLGCGGALVSTAFRLLELFK